MKKIITILIGLLLPICVFSNRDVLNIHLKDGSVKTFEVENIEKMTFTEESEKTEDNLIGTWKSSGGMMEAMGLTQYLRFSVDGRYDEIDLDEGVYDDHLYGQYKVDGSTMTVSGGNTIGISAEIVKLSSEGLTLKTLGITQDYIKVDDSEMDQYL